LRGLIVEKFGTLGRFAREIGISETSLSLKLNNRTPFKQADIETICSTLEIPPEEISVFFFDKLLKKI
jgi:DNA-binding Xre family transcriptional regulator